MNKANFFDDVQAKIQSVIDNSPAKDIQKNVRATLSQGFSKLDLITREEFDIQTQVLAKTREKLTMLEARMTEMERLLSAQSVAASTASSSGHHTGAHGEKHPK